MRRGEEEKAIVIYLMRVAVNLDTDQKGLLTMVVVQRDEVCWTRLASVVQEWAKTQVLARGKSSIVFASETQRADAARQGRKAL